jgi:hypothetical protein
MMTFRKLAPILFCVLVAGSVCGQGFPWDDFKRRTMTEIIKINNDDSVEDFKRLNSQNALIVRNNFLPSVIRLTYTSDVRPVGQARLKFIEMWVAVIAKQKDLHKLYQREFLFKEGADEYWMPVQEPVTKYFDKELKNGDLVDLYVVRPGGVKTGDQVDWVFLVEEFQKLKE